MLIRSAFHLDCSAVIPECDYQCADCLEEIRSVIEGMHGVSKFYTEGELGEDLAIIVEHDPEGVAVGELTAAFGRLPSFYRGFFAPKLLKA